MCILHLSTIQYGVRGMILAAQSEAFKQENGMIGTVVMDEAHASSAAESVRDTIGLSLLRSSSGWTQSERIIILWDEGGGYVRFDNQSNERERLIRIGFVLDFVEFISFTFGDKEIILVNEARGAKDTLGDTILGVSMLKDLESLHLEIFYSVMSSASSAVTYTSVYIDYEPGRLVAPPSLDYVPGPEHPPSLVEVLYIPEPEYPEYLVLSDDEAPMKNQPLPADASPVALSPGYVADFDPKEDPEEDHADYPADGGDDDEEPSDDDHDDDTGGEDEEPFDDEEDDEEEEEHLAPADSPTVHVIDPIPSAEDIEAFETNEVTPTHVPSPRRHTARMSIRPQTPVPLPSGEEGELSAVLGQIQALQDRDKTHTNDRESAGDHTATARLLLQQARACCLLLNTIGHGDESHNSHTGTKGTVRIPRKCTYIEFLNCKPLTFKGTEGVVVLSQWFEKMESVFHINNYAMENQVKFAIYTFLGNALTWWNSHMKTVTQDFAYAMDWKALKKMMTVKYCPRGEIKKLEIKLWNLKVKGTDVVSYTMRFQELALENVMSYQPKTMEKAIEFANDQMDQKVLTITERQAEQKRKLEFNAGNNQGHQQQNKRQNTGRAYTVGPGEKREYTGSLPLCTKCNYHHKGPCAPRCNKCKKIGHLARDCRSSGPNGNNNNRGNFGTTQNAVTCYECGVQGHFKKDCLKLKNGNRGNQRGNGNAPAKVYVVGNAGTNPDSNVVNGNVFF
ncbi:reverse transcriptase domain-containing protein [Tanacetum coccineum]